MGDKRRTECPEGALGRLQFSSIRAKQPQRVERAKGLLPPTISWISAGCIAVNLRGAAGNVSNLVGLVPNGVVVSAFVGVTGNVPVVRTVFVTVEDSAGESVLIGRLPRSRGFLRGFGASSIRQADVFGSCWFDDSNRFGAKCHFAPRGVLGSTGRTVRGGRGSPVLADGGSSTIGSRMRRQSWIRLLNSPLLEGIDASR